MSGVMDVLKIALIAYVGVWAIDKGLAMAGLSRFAVNAPN